METYIGYCFFFKLLKTVEDLLKTTLKSSKASITVRFIGCAETFVIPSLARSNTDLRTCHWMSSL